MRPLTLRDQHTHPHKCFLKPRARLGWDPLLGALLAAAALLLFVYGVLSQP